MIVDAHAHISDSSYGNIELYKKQMQIAGVEMGIVVPGGMLDVRRMTDYITGILQPDNVVPNNAYVKDAFTNSEFQIKGFVCIDPHTPNALETLTENRNNGFVGLKFSPISHQFSFLSKSVMNIVSACEDYGFPVYSHVLYNPGASTGKFIRLAEQFPKVNFILGHMGFGPADREGLDAACKLNNFYLETSTGSYLHIKEAVQKTSSEKIIFGSEFPLSHPKAEIEKILLLGLKDNDSDKILGKNILSLLPL